MSASDGSWACRGIRGATTAIANTAEDILEATDELMRTVIALNELEPADVASVIFTTTPDLTATFPALAARDIGWTEVPLMCAHEMAVPGSLQKCVRVMIHVNTIRTAAEIRHVYLKDARELRPEWAYSDDDVAGILAKEPVEVGQ
ncbi:MAG TPA: chorismate mutase [Thermomicrobiales bacterium]|nr:chorismate mutase [Thermomicrobiales bacterium]